MLRRVPDVHRSGSGRLGAPHGVRRARSFVRPRHVARVDRPGFIAPTPSSVTAIGGCDNPLDTLGVTVQDWHESRDDLPLFRIAER